MTLLAAFQLDDSPALLGDLLVTRGDGAKRSRRKLLRIAPNFVIGWAGHEIAADLVATALQAKLDLNAVTKRSVEQVLTDPAVAADVGEVLEVVLLGWVVDEEGQHAFRWRSSWPKVVFFARAPFFDGSGGFAAQAMMGSGNIKVKRPDSADGDDNVRNALYFATKLMAHELFLSATLTFGYGYEILRFIGDRFEYIDDLLYFAVQIDCDARDRYVRHKIVGSIVKYLVVDEFAILATCTNGATATVDLINPIGQFSDSRAQQILQEFQARKSFPFQSNDYCMFNIYRVDGVLFESFVQTISCSNPSVDEFIHISDGGFDVSTRAPMHTEMLKEMRRDRALKVPGRQR